MDVQQIVDRILDFSLDETDADNVLETRVLSDVNEVYKSLQHEISDVATADYMLTETVTITGGVGTCSPQLRTFSVYDNGDNRFLTETDILTLEQDSPSLDNTGAPTQFYITGGTTMNTYPLNDTTVRFRYYPEVNELLLTSTESEILAPKHLHQTLVDGGIYLMALREQGFHDRLDRGEKLQTWMASNSLVAAYLNNRNRAPRRVAYHD